MSKQIPDGERQFAVQTALSEVGLMFDGLTPKKNVKEAMAIWLHGNLPHQLVPEADLRILLRQTQDNIRQYRQELLVPPDQWDLYYHKTNVRCGITSDEFLTGIHIPLNGINENHLLVELHPIYYRASDSDAR